MDVLVVGDANPDLVLRGDVRPRFGQAEQLLSGADLVLGGSAAITAAGCARLGLRTALLTAVGADVFGAFTRQRLEERGVELLLAGAGADVPTGLSVILSAEDDRAILTLPGTIPALRPEDVTDAHLAATRHLHVASLYLQPRLAAGLAGIFARARAAGVGTSLDTNWDPAERWESVTEILEHTDVFLPNANELRAVTGEDDLDAAAARLTRLGTTVVMKNGAAGARAWAPEGEWAAPGRTVEVADTTGAGDSFNAGFLAGRLAGLPTAEAIGWAAAAGSLSTRAAGGTAAQATREELSPSGR
ncbi:sugar kinase [Actinoplanes sp. NBRC 14428]|uniref:Sugar/nucleoside kinase (Ribokinase family) n=1 Tax=Pseudosporangium ferrugineum TaxID=439699 RepID=A0A2T0SFW8_9ACTN|nr:sugar kinase [Pseudosporangium ferrugineum]PRY32305.1 sugar/nucleoside kinase (ribokinase family) [Pseudosporangium ferrugineum]BCJ49442.1 sugar kinase [Actinoplanes sp. NBRC 14428]